jgi:hypothetical protein
MYAQTVRLLLEGKEFNVITKVKHNISKLPSKHDNSCVLAITLKHFVLLLNSNTMGCPRLKQNYYS